MILIMDGESVTVGLYVKASETQLARIKKEYDLSKRGLIELGVLEYRMQRTKNGNCRVPYFNLRPHRGRMSNQCETAKGQSQKARHNSSPDTGGSNRSSGGTNEPANAPNGPNPSPP